MPDAPAGLEMPVLPTDEFMEPTVPDVVGDGSTTSSAFFKPAAMVLRAVVWNNIQLARTVRQE